MILKSGMRWKLKGNPKFTVIITHVLFGYVFFEYGWGNKDYLKKKTFLELFEYLDYIPTHQEMG